MLLDRKLALSNEHREQEAVGGLQSFQGDCQRPPQLSKAEFGLRTPAFRVGDRVRVDRLGRQIDESPPRRPLDGR